MLTLSHADIINHPMFEGVIRIQRHMAAAEYYRNIHFHLDPPRNIHRPRHGGGQAGKGYQVGLDPPYLPDKGFFQVIDENFALMPVTFQEGADVHCSEVFVSQVLNEKYFCHSYPIRGAAVAAFVEVMGLIRTYLTFIVSEI